MASTSVPKPPHTPTRILIFSLAYYPHLVGGAEVAVKEITDRLAAQNGNSVASHIAGLQTYSFDMVTIGDGRGVATEKIGAVTIHRVFTRISFFSKLFFPFAAFFKASSLYAASLRDKNPYDATWSIMANRAGFAALFFKWRYPQVPFILTLQEGDPLDYPLKRVGPIAPLLKPIFKQIFRRADRITALSKFLAEWARDMGAKAPVTIIPNGVDYDFFAPPDSKTNSSAANAAAPAPATDVAALKTKLAKKPGDIFLVTTSRLVAKNAVGDVIDALRYLPPTVKFLILGQGELEAALKAKAAELKFADRVIFLGHVAHADMPPYLHASDIFIRPSLSEGFGSSFVEAMAAGIPVIATPVGGIPDFLRDGETGLFCEPGNPRSIAQKVEKLMRDRESREHIVRQARDMVSATYRWEQIAADMKSVFDSATLKP